MHSISALELPEITEIIAGYLDNLEPCLTVCKAWRSLYLPYYWREVTAGIQIPGNKDRAPFFDPIRHKSYCGFVQKLSVNDYFGSIDRPLSYPNLRLLRLCYPSARVRSSPDHEDSVLKDFVNRHPLLECLDLVDIPSSIADLAWTALVNHPRLKKVSLTPESSVPDEFWRVCARLQALEFSYSAQDHIPKDLMLPSIRQLKLAGLQSLGLMEQLDIIAACPQLEDLEWVVGGSSTHPVWARFGQLATQGIWSHLGRLSIYSHAKDEDLSQIIASMHQATKINVFSEVFGPLSAAAVQRHASTLRHLSFPSVAESWMIRDALCTCTSLVHLDALRIDAKDIAEGGPWACTSLRRMSVKISFNNGEDYLQPVIFERISGLVHLEEFNNRFDYLFGTRPQHGLIFRLQSGMGALASLSRLRSVWLDSSVQGIDFDDAQWILDNWKRLETIRGRLSRDKSIAEQLGAFISMSGIELLSNVTAVE